MVSERSVGPCFDSVVMVDNQNAKSSDFSRYDFGLHGRRHRLVFFITRVVFRNILLIVRLTYPIDFGNTLLVPMCKFIMIENKIR
jgi:hypothetical protein